MLISELLVQTGEILPWAKEKLREISCKFLSHMERKRKIEMKKIKKYRKLGKGIRNYRLKDTSKSHALHGDSVTFTHLVRFHPTSSRHWYKNLAWTFVLWQKWHLMHRLITTIVNRTHYDNTSYSISFCVEEACYCRALCSLYHVVMLTFFVKVKWWLGCYRETLFRNLKWRVVTEPYLRLWVVIGASAPYTVTDIWTVFSRYRGCSTNLNNFNTKKN